jgi:hypothetical protein
MAVADGVRAAGPGTDLIEHQIQEGALIKSPKSEVRSSKAEARDSGFDVLPSTVQGSRFVVGGVPAHHSALDVRCSMFDVHRSLA